MRNAILFLCVAVSLASCMFGSQNAIIGKWNAIDTGPVWQPVAWVASIEFLGDSTVNITDGNTQLAVVGSYKFLDDKRIRMDFTGLAGLGGPLLCEVTISGDRMTLKREGDEEGQFIKVR